MKRLLLCSTLLASGFVFAPNQAKAQASNCTETVGNFVSGYHVPDNPDVNTDNYGIWIDARVRSADVNSCDYYVTNFYHDTFTN